MFPHSPHSIEKQHFEYKNVCFINLFLNWKDWINSGKNWIPESHSWNLKNFNIFLKFILSFWSCHTTCRILVSQPGIEPESPAEEVHSANHGTARNSRISTFVKRQITKFLLFSKEQQGQQTTSSSVLLKYNSY